MGLFLTEDGHYQGWLAAFLCCCAAIDQDESPAEIRKSKTSNKTDTCYAQSQPMQHSTSTLTLHAFKTDETQSSGDRRPNRISARPPSLHPLDFEEKPLVGSWSRQATPTSSSSTNQRPYISSPYAFRRLDQTEPQRQGLIPLRLGPVVLRESPIDALSTPKPVLNRDKTRFESTDDLLPDSARPHSYRENRESPFQRCQQQSGNAMSIQSSEGQNEASLTGFESADIVQARPPLTLQTNTGFHNRQESAATTMSVKSRPSNERSRLKRKQSLPSPSKDDQLEQEILELNTIVKERRAENARDKRSSQHVPAVAPTMQVRARSETLNSIGSALSRSLPMRGVQDPQPIPTNTNTYHGVIERPGSTTSWTSSQRSASFSDVLPSSSPVHLPTGEPFYKCQMSGHQQRRASEGSASTWLTELESPLTASSPISQGHSRHHTDESRTTPLSPYTPRDGSHGIGVSRSGKESQWPFLTITNTEVGLAF